MRQIKAFLVLSIIFFAPVSKSLLAQTCHFSGTYTVGSTGHFLSLKVALDSIKLNGVSGNVILELTDTYNSNLETFPVIFPKTQQIPCLGNAKIVVRPATGVSNIIIGGTNTNTIILADSVHYLTIDGRPGGVGNSSGLSIINNGPAPSMKLINASNNNFLYTRFGGVAGAGTTEGIINLHASKAAGSDNNKVEFCTFYSVNTAPVAKQVLLKSTGSGGIENNNDSVINCNFQDFSRHAIELGEESDGWTIQSNSFYATANINYEDVAAAIKINSPLTDVQHTINHNYFGGNAPWAQGDPMLINYGAAFYCLDITGSSYILNNIFARLKFVNTVNSGNSQIRMINISNGSDYTIYANNFGFGNLADSIHVTNSFSDMTDVSALFCADIYNQNLVNFNNFNNIRCYSESGGIRLKIMCIAGGYASIINNVVGHPGILNSILNNSNAETHGIFEVNTLAKVNGNIISRIASTSPGPNAGVWGIFATGVSGSGYIDSICNNQVSQLTSASSGSSGYPVVGIGVHANVGGYAGLVANNRIHSLHNLNTEDGSVTGLHVSKYLNLQSNFIHSLNTSALATAHITGILVTDKESTVENNMVSLGVDSSGNNLTGPNLFITGISGGHDMKHNSVYIGGTDVGGQLGAGSFCYEFFGNALPTAVSNNIFYNARTNADPASTRKHQCVAIDLSFSCDYNLFNYNGNGGMLGTYQGTRYNAFSEWKAGSAKDANSIFADPVFKTPLGGVNGIDLHLKQGSPAEGSGGNATVAADFDYQNRNTLTPIDIGADAGNYGCAFSVNASADATISEGASMQIGTPGVTGVVYSWTSNPAGFSSALANPIVSPISTTQYFLTASDGVCTLNDSLKVTVLADSLILCPGDTTRITAATVGSVYQWQADTGSGFLPLTNNSFYSHVNTSMLTIYHLPSSFYGYKYRVVVDGNNGPVKTIKVQNMWTGSVNNFWNEPGNWSCRKVPDGNTDVVIHSGTILLNANGTCRTIYVAPGVMFTIGTGFNLTVTH